MPTKCPIGVRSARQVGNGGPTKGRVPGPKLSPQDFGSLRIYKRRGVASVFFSSTTIQAAAPSFRPLHQCSGSYTSVQAATSAFRQLHYCSGSCISAFRQLHQRSGRRTIVQAATMMTEDLQRSHHHSCSSLRRPGRSTTAPSPCYA